jgi:hypothetical protein
MTESSDVQIRLFSPPQRCLHFDFRVSTYLLTACLPVSSSPDDEVFRLWSPQMVFLSSHDGCRISPMLLGRVAGAAIRLEAASLVCNTFFCLLNVECLSTVQDRSRSLTAAASQPHIAAQLHACMQAVKSTAGLHALITCIFNAFVA